MEYRPQFEAARQTTVVIVEDDWALGAQMLTYLLRDGYTVHSLTGVFGLSNYLHSNDFDIGIFSLDPNESEMIQFLNQNHLFRQKGIVCTTHKTDQRSKLMALKEGADHWLSKPLLLEELSFVTLNLAMRIKGKQKPSWLLDRRKWELIAPNAQCIKLTNLEQLVLEKLAVGNGGVISKDDIAVALGYSPSVYDFRRLEVIIRRLRNKAKLVLGIEIPLKTAHRRGYAFTDNIKVLDF